MKAGQQTLTSTAARNVGSPRDQSFSWSTSNGSSQSGLVVRSRSIANQRARRAVTRESVPSELSNAAQLIRWTSALSATPQAGFRSPTTTSQIVAGPIDQQPSAATAILHHGHSGHGHESFGVYRKRDFLCVSSVTCIEILNSCLRYSTSACLRSFLSAA